MSYEKPHSNSKVEEAFKLKSLVESYRQQTLVMQENPGKEELRIVLDKADAKQGLDMLRGL